MPNLWEHEQVEGSTCIAPEYAPYGRWNIDEILYAALPWIVGVSAWRLFFVFVIGKYLGGYITRRQYPNPSPKPSFCIFEKNQSNISQIKTLYDKHIQSHAHKKIPKKKKTTEKHSKNEIYIQRQNHYSNSNQRLKNRNENKNKNKNVYTRKPLILPKGIPSPQSPINLAFLASLKSDECRSEIAVLMKSLDYSLTEIRQFWYWQRDRDAMSALSLKFNEEAWKGITMTFITIYGIYVMCNESFFNDPSLLFQQWPQLESPAVFLYYQIAIGYHTHRALWQFWDAKRTDIIAMFVHHWVTVILISTSWYWGLMNIGALVMVCHDNSDIFLPFGKLGRWANIPFLKNIAFGLFVSSWVISRIILFSMKVIIPVFVYASVAYSCHYWKYVFFASLLSILLFLHLYWFHMIAKVAIDWIFCNKQVEDIRSTDEEDEIVITAQDFSYPDNSCLTDNSNHEFNDNCSSPESSLYKHE